MKACPAGTIIHEKCARDASLEPRRHPGELEVEIHGKSGERPLPAQPPVEGIHRKGLRRLLHNGSQLAPESLMIVRECGQKNGSFFSAKRLLLMEFGQRGNKPWVQIFYLTNTI